MSSTEINFVETLCSFRKIYLATSREESTVLDFCVPPQESLFQLRHCYLVSRVEPSSYGKTQLIDEWLTIGTFQPNSNKVSFFYSQYESVYDKVQKEIDCIEDVKG